MGIMEKKMEATKREKITQGSLPEGPLSGAAEWSWRADLYIYLDSRLVSQLDT